MMERLSRPEASQTRQRWPSRSRTASLSPSEVFPVLPFKRVAGWTQAKASTFAFPHGQCRTRWRPAFTFLLPRRNGKESAGLFPALRRVLSSIHLPRRGDTAPSLERASTSASGQHMTLPRSFARAIPSRCRSRIRSRSNRANAPMTLSKRCDSPWGLPIAWFRNDSVNSTLLRQTNG